jgi:hypothetical protein
VRRGACERGPCAHEAEPQTLVLRCIVCADAFVEALFGNAIADITALRDEYVAARKAPDAAALECEIG